MSLTRLCVTAVVVACGAIASRSAEAQPTAFIDLGERFVPETITVEIDLPASNAVQWIRVVLPPLSADAGFLDVASRIEAFAEPWMMDPVAYLFDGNGLWLQTVGSLGQGGDTQLWASFGLVSEPRSPYCFTAVHDTGPLFCDTTPFAGQNGPLAGGEYWLAFGNNGIGCRREGWSCHGTFPDWFNLTRCTLDIRIQPPDVPYCEGDFNWDGNTDQDDAMYLANVLAGGDNPTGRFADYNRDGNEDQDDLLALVHTIAGGGCP